MGFFNWFIVKVASMDDNKRVAESLIRKNEKKQRTESLTNMSLDALNDEQWEEFTNKVDEGTVITSLINVFENDEDLNFLLDSTPSFWNPDSVLDSITLLKKQVFEVAADRRRRN